LEGLEPADQILTLISKEGADAVLDLDESLRIVTDAVCFNVINDVPCRENVGVCLQGVFGYKGSLNLFVFSLRLSRASVVNSSQEGVIEDLA
jgi:hypothetical protein